MATLFWIVSRDNVKKIIKLRKTIELCIYVKLKKVITQIHDALTLLRDSFASLRGHYFAKTCNYHVMTY